MPKWLEMAYVEAEACDGRSKASTSGFNQTVDNSWADGYGYFQPKG